MFIVTGCQWPDRELRLSLEDCNMLCNLLTDRRKNLFQKPIDGSRHYMKMVIGNINFLAGLIDEYQHEHATPNFYNTEIAEMRGVANKLADMAR